MRWLSGKSRPMPPEGSYPPELERKFQELRMATHDLFNEAVKHQALIHRESQSFKLAEEALLRREDRERR